MLPESPLELAEECNRMYKVAADAVREGGTPVSAAWLYRLAREIAERGDDLTHYELPAEALIWNFVSMFYLVRWTWRTLEPPPNEPPLLDCAPWDKPASELSQLEFRDSLHALALRWTTMRPGPELWRWIDQLDRRAADLCVRSDLGEMLDEDFRAIEGSRVATDEFITDTAAIMNDMVRARFVHRDFLRCVVRVYAPSSRLPVASASEWLDREYDRLTSEAREALDGELARLSVRPGEIARYAHTRQGVVPDDLRAVIRHCRPSFSDYRKETPMKPYLVFGRICQRRSFEWLQLALITDQDYFRETAEGVRYCDVMASLREPTIVRLMGSDYVYRGASGSPNERRAWRCSSPVEAICLWISLVSPRYQLESAQWDLGFLKELLGTWRDGERVRHNEPLLV